MTRAARGKQRDSSCSPASRVRKATGKKEDRGNRLQGHLRASAEMEYVCAGKGQAFLKPASLPRKVTARNLSSGAGQRGGRLV